MKILLFGATGMVGAGALLECLADPRVQSVLSISRSPSGRTHTKLREVIHADFFAYDGLQADFANADACFFCLGVSSVGMNEGVGTDSSEQGRSRDQLRGLWHSNAGHDR